jgi:protocatechuate 3,4-dioxygenase beta subunit
MMTPNLQLHARRDFLRRLGIGAATIAAGRLFEPGVFANLLEDAQRVRTPSMTEGPFYPDRLPLDTDNDLIVMNDALTPAVGEITHLTGRILDSRGDPVRNALVEIWQVDHHGSYLHRDGSPSGKRDGNFQGFGRFLTGTNGQYYFRTIKPVRYPGRAPHIHVKVKIDGREELSTQCMVNGDPLTARDGLVLAIRNEAQRRAILVEFNPIKDSTIGELAANFDVVLGFTPKA